MPAQQWRGQHNCDQYWGGLLTAPAGVFECYMSVKDVAKARIARERAELESEAERLERVKASREELRVVEAREAEEAAAGERLRERRKAAQLRNERDADLGEGGVSHERRSSGESKRTRRNGSAKMNLQLWVTCAACVVLFPVLVNLILTKRRALRESYEPEIWEE